MEELELLRSERDELKQELERLSCELEQTNHEKNLSAKYGLNLLEEKAMLQNRCEELENCYELTRSELEMIRQALQKYQSSQKATTTTGIEEEENLLQQTASLEATFTSTVAELQKELKQARQEVARIDVEKEKILQENIDLTKNCDVSDWEKKNYKAELKELKQRESRLLSDNNELEEENISLQKQVLALRSSQVEFEGAKHEIRRLQEDVDSSNAQIEELKTLKRIAEKQLEEALEALLLEREQKYAIRKELDQRVNSESIFSLNNIAFSGFGLGNTSFDDQAEEEETDDAIFQHIDAPFSRKSIDSTPSLGSTVGDLFSEVHLSELQKLEKQLEQAENDKAKISAKVQESQQVLEKTKLELKEQNSCVLKIIDHIKALDLLYNHFDVDGEDITSSEKVSHDIGVKKFLQKYEQRHELALKEVKQLQKITEILQSEADDQTEDITEGKLKEEITKQKIKICSFERKIRELQNDIEVMGKIAKEAQSRMTITQNDLTSVSEELAQLYYHVCFVNGETPSRIMLDHVKCAHQKGDVRNVSTEQKQPVEVPNAEAQQGQDEKNRFDSLKDELKTEISVRFLMDSDQANTQTASDTCSRLLVTIHDQICHLKKAIENSIELNRQKSLPTDGQPSSLTEVVELQKQVLSYKSLLSTKREQITAFRTVMKANKHTAEIALNNLKSKYEKEKAIVSETMMKLRYELKVMKEDAATFASLRAMFAARCEENVTQIDELQRKISASDEEKKTLNVLLKTAIKEKLMVKQQLNELEADSKERSQIRRPSSRGRNFLPRSRSQQSSSSSNAFSSNRQGSQNNYYHR